MSIRRLLAFSVRLVGLARRPGLARWRCFRGRFATLARLRWCRIDRDSVDAPCVADLYEPKLELDLRRLRWKSPDEVQLVLWCHIRLLGEIWRKKQDRMQGDVPAAQIGENDR